MYASFNRFEIQMTKAQASSGSHQGDCEQDVRALVAEPAIRRQLDKIGLGNIQAELKEYGAWDEEELKNEEWCRLRIMWIAAGNINEERK